ncbi:MAG: FAD:protein FMN transferase, partial [Oscillospiraceae bacterium]|nr:FAD:protein FMN transferase [Oscillospiraceae bacterium]
MKAMEKQTLSLFAMDTFMEMQVYGDEALLAGAAEMIRDLDARLSVTAEESEIHALNAQGHAVVSADTAALVQSALALCARTDGALDISIYPVVRAWGFT